MPCPARTDAPLSRGVYKLDARTITNERILIAVNRWGQRIAERCVAGDTAAAHAELSALLDRMDPPYLQLVRESIV